MLIYPESRFHASLEDVSVVVPIAIAKAADFNFGSFYPGPTAGTVDVNGRRSFQRRRPDSSQVRRHRRRQHHLDRSQR